MAEEIKLTKRTIDESLDYLLSKGLSESGAVTRACLTSMAMLVDRASREALESLKIIMNLKEGCECPNHLKFSKHACPCTLKILTVKDAYRAALRGQGKSK